jgi:Fe-S-cluster containining protein
MARRPRIAIDPVTQLCLECGLCCNGVLFADVELQKSDDAKRLIRLGLLPEKKGRGKLAFNQPCACFDGQLCGIYAQRPKRCRTFECGLLKRVQEGGLTPAVALKSILKTKQQVEKIRVLLRKLGEKNESLPLTKRYSQAMMAPIDLSTGKLESQKRGQLMRNMDRLMTVIQRDFLG